MQNLLEGTEFWFDTLTKSTKNELVNRELSSRQSHVTLSHMRSIGKKFNKNNRGWASRIEKRVKRPERFMFQSSMENQE